MFRNGLAIILFGSFITTSSFASNFTDKLKITGKINKHEIAANKREIKKYTDFSGVWTGKCSDHDEAGAEEVTVTINNDANIMFLDDLEIIIGDLKTESSSGKYQTSFSHNTYFWNEDRSMLIIKGMGIAKDNLNGILSYIVNGSMSLKDGQLIVKEEGGIFSDLTQQIDSINYTCTFNKAMESHI